MAETYVSRKIPSYKVEAMYWRGTSGEVVQIINWFQEKGFTGRYTETQREGTNGVDETLSYREKDGSGGSVFDRNTVIVYHNYYDNTIDRQLEYFDGWSPDEFEKVFEKTE